MIGKYSVGFLIPKNANRFLGDDGWEFECDLRLPANIESLLGNQLSLCESSPVFSSYDGPGLKADVLKDKFGNIESIYFRFYENTVPELPDFLKGIEDSDQLEFFIPPSK